MKSALHIITVLVMLPFMVVGAIAGIIVGGLGGGYEAFKDYINWLSS